MRLAPKTDACGSQRSAGGLGAAEDEFCLVGVLLLQFLVSGCDSESIFFFFMLADMPFIVCVWFFSGGKMKC